MPPSHFLSMPLFWIRLPEALLHTIGGPVLVFHCETCADTCSAEALLKSFFRYPFVFGHPCIFA